MIIDERLKDWHKQKRAEGGHIAHAHSDDHKNRLDEKLTTIQAQSEILWECTWLHFEMVEKLAPIITEPNPKENISIMDSELLSLLSAMVRATFVVENEPPRVLEMNTPFETSARLLIGRGINVYHRPPQVNVTIISAAQAGKPDSKGNFPTADEAGEISNSSGRMKYQDATGNLAVSFKNISLTGMKGTRESLIGERFCLLYESAIKVGDFTFNAQARSLPVSVQVSKDDNMEF